MSDNTTSWRDLKPGTSRARLRCTGIHCRVAATRSGLVHALSPIVHTWCGRRSAQPRRGPLAATART